VTVRSVRGAVGSTGATTAAYRVDLRVGAHELTADEPIASGGGDVGPTPFGLLASALAACTSITLRMYAMRKGWEVTPMEVDIRLDLDDDDALSIERIVTLPATLTDEQLEHVAGIAERTPVTLALKRGTSIVTSFTSRPHPPDDGVDEAGRESFPASDPPASNAGRQQ
jgi:putative redox protein